MARLPRLDLPGVPQHIVQRGNNRLPCFLDDGDRLRYLTLLREALKTTGVHLHAYVLMDNDVHLLVTPRAAGAVARMMQRLGRQYVGSSTLATDGPGRSGKAATRPAWSTASTICWPATATSNYTPCAHARSRNRPVAAGPAVRRTWECDPTPASTRMPPGSPFVRPLPNDPSATEPCFLNRSGRPCWTRSASPCSNSVHGAGRLPRHGRSQDPSVRCGQTSRPPAQGDPAG